MSPRIEDLSFLVLEDDCRQRQRLANMLNSLGAREVRIARNGAEAMQALREGGPADVLAVDIFMPAARGLEVLAVAMTLDCRPALLLTSASGWMLQVAKIFAEGEGLVVLDTLAKPIARQMLRMRFKGALAGRRFARAAATATATASMAAAG